MQKGKVYRSTGSWYDVKLDTGIFIKARIQGKFRNQSIKTTNPISVGDEVDLLVNENNEAVIKNIHPRKITSLENPLIFQKRHILLPLI